MNFLRSRHHHSSVGHIAVVIIVCVSCLLMADLSTASFTRNCTEQEVTYNPYGNNQGICGPALSNELQWRCRPRGYNGRPIFSKRAAAILSRNLDGSSDDFLARLMDPRETESVEERSTEFLDGSKALAFLQYKRQSYDMQSNGRYVQNIVCECCVHSCDTTELMTYCMP